MPADVKFQADLQLQKTALSAKRFSKIIIQRAAAKVFMHFNLKRFFFLFASSAPVVIRRYLHSVHCDVDETKKLIEHSYSLRSKYPNIFFNRDPLDVDVQKMFDVA